MLKRLNILTTMCVNVHFRCLSYILQQFFLKFFQHNILQFKVDLITVEE